MARSLAAGSGVLAPNSFLVMAHGTAEEMVRTKTILGTANPSGLDVHAGVKANLSRPDISSTQVVEQYSQHDLDIDADSEPLKPARQ